MKRFRRKQHGKMAETEPEGMNIKNSTEGGKKLWQFSS